MIIRPKIRGFICTTAHPVGCSQHVQTQIDYVKKHPSILKGPKNALVIGASTGYGLASRIVAAFGCRAGTMGVFFERPSENKRTATAGWYNAIAFEKKAHAEGLYAKSFNADAFCDEIKERVVETVRKDLGRLDLIIYSVASPRRLHPKTGSVDKSVLKPIGTSYTNKSIDFDTNEIVQVTLPAATEEEIHQTVSVMGGEDWEMWMDSLDRGGLIAEGALSVAYSYIGPEVTYAVYRGGTIGKAKDHLEQTAKKLTERLKNKNAKALISINKALVTQSSSAIPFIPLYFVILRKVMKQKGLDEDCIQQMYRLFSSRLYAKSEIPADSHGRIRIDDLEVRPDIQEEVMRLWQIVTTENLPEIADLKGYREDFLKLFGFGFPEVDYYQDVDPNLQFS